MGLEQPDEDVHTALDRTVNHLDQTLTGLQQSLERDHSTTTDVREGLAKISDAWLGIVEVTVTLSDLTQRRLTTSSTLSRATVDIVSEAISNATIHGAARRVDVVVEFFGEELSIKVSDDGVGPPAEIKVGSGLAKISDTHTAWELSHNEPVGAVFRAVLPAASVDFG